MGVPSDPACPFDGSEEARATRHGIEEREPSPRVTCIGNRRRSGMEQVVGIQTVHHIDVVTCIRQRMSQAVDENSIPAETVGRVKGRQMQEVKWSQPGRNTNVSRLSVPGSMLRGFAGW